MKNKRIVSEYILIAFGSLCLAFAVDVFFVPRRITSGGISTVGTVLFYLTGIPLSVTNLVLNAVLLIFGYKTLGKGMLYKTLSGIIFLTVFLELCTYFPTYGEDMLISTLAGGILMGFGIGLVVRFGGSTGGTDFLGIIIHKKLSHISVANIIFFIDCAVIGAAGIIFGSITIIMYSAMALFVSSKICDWVISFGNAAKAVSIISINCSIIADAIMLRHGRGVTGLYCRGMYTGKNSLMIYCVVSPRELPHVLRTVRQIDNGAFMVISDVKDVLGNGFNMS